MAKQEEQQSAPGGDLVGNALPDPSLFASDGSHPKAKRKRRGGDEGGGLNMNSLMDIMTILLVFLLKSYSANPVQLKSSEDLKLPTSTAQLMPTETTAVTVTSNGIMVDDEPVMTIENAVVPESQRSSGGYLIDPLYQALQQSVEHQKKISKFNKKLEFQGLITIISDREVPFSLLSQVMYTAGQAQFSKFKFAVIKAG
jgi:biopolymer transport protein ExbD